MKNTKKIIFSFLLIGSFCSCSLFDTGTSSRKNYYGGLSSSGTTCPSDATQSSDGSSCVCTDNTKYYNTTQNACLTNPCTGLQWPFDGVCTNCPAGSAINTNNTTCNCSVGFFDSTSNTCANVYIAGTDQDAPVYWKNDKNTKINLPLPSGSGTSGNIATSIFLPDNNNIYVSGYYNLSGITKGAYWTNGSRSDLGSVFFSPTITTSGGGYIYVAGTVANGTSPNHKGTYWLAGTSQTLNTAPLTANSYASAVALDTNETLYLAGAVNADTTPVYWYGNGTAQQSLSLPTGTTGIVKVSSMYINGTDIYVAGYSGNGYLESGIVSGAKAFYWKNTNSRTDISTANSIILSIFVKDADVYVSGAYKNGTKVQAAYWKNNVKTDLNCLSTAFDSSVATGIFVKGSDVFVSGTCNDNNIDYTVAVYWKNGTLFTLSNNTSNGYSEARSIYVK